MSESEGADKGREKKEKIQRRDERSRGEENYTLTWIQKLTGVVCSQERKTNESLGRGL